MRESFNLIRLLALICAAVAITGKASAQEQPVRFAGAQCTTPAWLHCPDKDCPSDRVINPGPVVEMKTRRTYFLDYPCDLKPGEKVTFILSLHGAGSYGNWQRHYFPIMDYKDKYRLVMPPAVSFSLYFIFLGIWWLVFGPRLVWAWHAGYVLGYVYYDVTHYYIHHHNPKTAYGRRLKKNHMLHHFKDPNSRYCVSNMLWDGLFGTVGDRTVR